MEHFEFVEAFFRSIPALATELYPSKLENMLQLARPTAIQAANAFREGFHLGLDATTYSWFREMAHSEEDAYVNVLYKHLVLNITYYCNALLAEFDQQSRDISYENDGSRGNGGNRSRRQATSYQGFLTPADPGLSLMPTSFSDQSPSASQSVAAEIEVPKTQKRRRPVLAPALSAAGPSASALQPTLQSDGQGGTRAVRNARTRAGSSRMAMPPHGNSTC
jgi:hypothetical protein